MKLNGMAIRRSYMEVPTMDERKWEKLPGIAADVFYADLEDSVPPKLKEAARDKVLSLVHDPAYFGGREFICRPNNITTPWGRDDLEALAEAGAPYLLYPKVRSAEELHEVKAIFERHAAAPEIMLLVETPEALLRLESIASIEGVTGLAFGPGDLSIETGISLLDGPVPFSAGMLYARGRTVMVARALGLEAIDGLFVADLKDLDSVRAVARQTRRLGFTGTQTFYPPHVTIINEEFSPGPGEIDRSRRMLHAQEEAHALGHKIATLDGRALSTHQLAEAQRALLIADTMHA